MKFAKSLLTQMLVIYRRAGFRYFYDNAFLNLYMHESSREGMVAIYQSTRYSYKNQYYERNHTDGTYSKTNCNIDFLIEIETAF